MRSQRLIALGAHWAHGGSMPRDGAGEDRDEHDARAPSSRSPTTSWPGTNGNDTIGSK